MRKAACLLSVLVACSPDARRSEIATLSVATPADASTRSAALVDAAATDVTMAARSDIEHHPSVYPVFRFAPSETAVPAGAHEALTLFVAALRADGTARVIVKGRATTTEPKGTALARARAVAAALAYAGIAKGRVRAAETERPGAPTVEVIEVSGEPFSVLYTQWEACCRERTPAYAFPLTDVSRIADPGPVIYLVDNLRPDTPEGRSAQAQAEQKCAQCNGDWGVHGLAPIPGCLCRTHDARKPCSSPRECEGTCEISWTDAMRFHGAAQLPPGACSEFFFAFGCHGWIVETDAGARDTEWICRD